MNRYRKFALVIPTLEEATNITAVLDRVIAAMSRLDATWEILVVDDESIDGTAQIVSRYADLNSRVRLFVRRGCKGLAGAILYGWKQTDADLVGVIDADLQHPPELLPILIQQINEGSDIAVASRYVLADSMSEWNPIRRMLSRIGVLACKPVQRADLSISDPLSGFFVLRRECVKGLNFQPSGFKLLLEILVKGNISSATEVPFKFAERTHGNSKANAATGIQYIWLLCKLSCAKLFGARKAKGDPSDPVLLASRSAYVKRQQD